jgi:hypothetical protein
MAYFNRFHVGLESSAGLPCRTPGCRNTLATNVGRYLALLEYQLRHNPGATLKFDCPVCGRRSEFDRSSLMRVMPRGTGPVALSAGDKWAAILLEMPTDRAMPERAFLGERVLIHGVLQGPRCWAGSLASESQLAPSLGIGSILSGQVLNGHHVCTSVSTNGVSRVLPLIGSLPRGELDIATFLLPKTGHTELLQCANLECANPSCAHYFGLTYCQFRQTLLSQNPRVEAAGDGEPEAYLVLDCLICRTSRVVDARSFDGLYKL